MQMALARGFAETTSGTDVTVNSENAQRTAIRPAQMQGHQQPPMAIPKALNYAQLNGKCGYLHSGSQRRWSLHQNGPRRH
jgi:hypothetical protein